MLACGAVLCCSSQLLANYWPSAGEPAALDAPGGFSSRERAIEFATLMNGIPKLVLSKRPGPLEWGPPSASATISLATWPG